MNDTFLRARIVATETAIIAYEAALLALANGAQAYTLDTGQTRQQVTKLDLKNLNDVLDSLVNRLENYNQRLNANGNSIGRPGW